MYMEFYINSVKSDSQAVLTIQMPIHRNQEEKLLYQVKNIYADCSLYIDILIHYFNTHFSKSALNKDRSYFNEFTENFSWSHKYLVVSIANH